MTKETMPILPIEQQVATLEQHVAELQKAVIDLASLLDDHLVRLPADVDSCPGFVVIEDSPAYEAMVRIIARVGGLLRGGIHPIRRSEFESLKTDILALRVWPAEKGQDNG